MRTNTLIFILLFTLFTRSFATDLQTSNTNSEAPACNSEYYQNFYKELRILRYKVISAKDLVLLYSEINKDAERDKKISSALAIGSSSIMLGANLLLTRAILTGGAELAQISGITLTPIKLQLWAITQIKNLIASPLSKIGLNGVKALGGVASLSAVGADKGYGLYNGILNIVSDGNIIKINRDHLALTEGAYEQAIKTIKSYRENYIDQGPSPLANGLSFGKKAADYTMNLKILADYEAKLYEDLYTMKLARYKVENSSCK